MALALSVLVLWGVVLGSVARATSFAEAKAPVAAAWHAGMLYVVEMTENAVLRFDAKGRELPGWSLGSSVGARRPVNLAFTPAGLPVIADYWNSRVLILSDNGQNIVRTIGQDLLVSPEGVAVDEQGRIYVADYNLGEVLRFSPDGKLELRWKGDSSDGGTAFGLPHGIDVKGGYVYVADLTQYRLQKYTLDGKFVKGVGNRGAHAGQMNYPTNVSVDVQRNRVYVVEAHNSRVSVFDLDLNYQFSWGRLGSGEGEFALPYGVAVAPDGRIAIIDTFSKRVQLFDQNGRYLEQWPAPEKSTTASGSIVERSLPPDAVVRKDYSVDEEIRGLLPTPDGGYVLADTFNHRLMKLDRNGNRIKEDSTGYMPSSIIRDDSGFSVLAYGDILSYSEDFNLKNAWWYNRESYLWRSPGRGEPYPLSMTRTDGKYFLASFNSRSVSVIGLRGGLFGVLESVVDLPISVAPTAERVFVLGARGEIAVYDARSFERLSFEYNGPRLQSPQAIAIDAKRRLIFVAQGAGAGVAVIGFDGKYLETLAGDNRRRWQRATALSLSESDLHIWVDGGVSRVDLNTLYGRRVMPPSSDAVIKSPEVDSVLVNKSPFASLFSTYPITRELYKSYYRSQNSERAPLYDFRINPFDLPGDNRSLGAQLAPWFVARTGLLAWAIDDRSEVVRLAEVLLGKARRADDGALEWPYDYVQALADGSIVSAGKLSANSQIYAAALLARAWQASGREEFRRAAMAALKVLHRTGESALLAANGYLEDYPNDGPSGYLAEHLFAMVGLLELADAGIGEATLFYRRAEDWVLENHTRYETVFGSGRAFVNAPEVGKFSISKSYDINLLIDALIESKHSSRLAVLRVLPPLVDCAALSGGATVNEDGFYQSAPARNSLDDATEDNYTASVENVMPAIMQVNFNKACRLSKFRIVWESLQNYGKNFRIEAFIDNAWKRVANEADWAWEKAEQPVWKALSDDDRPATAVRLILDAAHGQQRLLLRGFSAYGYSSDTGAPVSNKVKYVTETVLKSLAAVALLASR